MKNCLKFCSASDLAKNINNSLLLDVRTPAEFEEMHIAGSELQPLTNLQPDKIKTLLGENKTCVLICRSGNRAKQAAQKLIDSGIESVNVLEGGITAWHNQGYPTKLGEKTISLERQVRIAAGFLVFASSILSLTLSVYWALLAAFVGAGLMFAGITDSCGMALVLAKMPWNNKIKSCSNSCKIK